LTSNQAQGEELIELFRGFDLILHGVVDFADWIAVLAYSAWLDFLFHPQYTEEDLAKLELLRRDMKRKMAESQLFTMSKYVGGWCTGCYWLELAGTGWYWLVSKAGNDWNLLVLAGIGWCPRLLLAGTGWYWSERKWKLMDGTL